LRLAFGTGSASDAIHVISFNVFCFFYYVQVIGVPGSLVGLMVAITLLIDAVSDPAVGMLSDRLRTRLGRRYPLMIISALPLGFCFAALFAPPVDFFTDSQGNRNNLALALYMLVFASGTRISLTCFSVPHLALGSELDPSRVGRSRMMSWHAIFLWIGGATCHFLGLTFFFVSDSDHPNGMLNPNNYPAYGLVWGGVMALAILVSIIFTIHRLPWLYTPNSKDSSTAGGVLKDFGEIFTNRNYLWLVAGMILYATTSGMHDAFSSHIAIYYFEFTTSQFRFYSIASLFGYIIGFLITTRLHQRADKVSVLSVSVLVNAVASSLAIWLRMAGWFPENGSPLLFPSVLLLVGLFYGSQSVMIISVMSLLGDIADEHELNKGWRREGVFYSARSFFGKVSSAAGTLIGGIMLDLIRFPLGENVLPGTVPEEIIYRMGISYGIVATVPALLAAFVYRQCRMTTARHSEVVRLLASRRTASQQAEALP